MNDTQIEPAPAPAEPAPRFYICACGHVLGRVNCRGELVVCVGDTVIYLTAGWIICPICGNRKGWLIRQVYRERKAEYREMQAKGERV